MEDKKVYVRVGEKAASFSDPSIPFNIVKGEILLMPTKTKKVDVALRHGHLERISEAEYLEITGTAKKTANDVLEEKLSKMKTAKELLAFMTNEGYEAEDIEKVKALSKLPEMVAAIIEIDKNYN